MPVARHETQRQNRLDRHVHGGHVERLEHDQRHALTESLGVQKEPPREQNEMFLKRRPCAKCRKNVVPDFLHAVPIWNNGEQWDTSMSRHHSCSAPRSSQSRHSRPSSIVSPHHFFRSSEAPSKLMLKRITMLPNVSHEPAKLRNDRKFHDATWIRRRIEMRTLRVAK